MLYSTMDLFGPFILGAVMGLGVMLLWSQVTMEDRCTESYDDGFKEGYIDALRRHAKGLKPRYGLVEQHDGEQRWEKLN